MSSDRNSALDLAILKRFPKPSFLGLAIQVVSALVSNGILVWLLQNGRAVGASVPVLLLLESMVLLIIVRIQHIGIPVKDWAEPPTPFLQRLPGLIFLLLWLGLAWGMSMLAFGQLAEFKPLIFQPIETFHRWGIFWPLVATGLSSLALWPQDRGHYQRHGGIFISSATLAVTSRALTLILGAIPFFVPFALAGYAVNQLIQRSKTGLIVGFPLLFLVVLVPGFLLEMGFNGWTISIVSAKLLSDVAVIAVPFVAPKETDLNKKKPNPP